MLTNIICKSGRLAALIAALSLILSWDINLAHAYNYPAGIPDPGMWGTTHPIDSAAPDTAVKCPGWPSTQTVGCYYVDNTHPNATDTNNPYGYPNKPRLWYPSTYAAGDLAEIHGGPYIGPQQNIVANGTAAKPVWIRGFDTNNKTVIRRQTVVNGQYLIMENLLFDVQLTTIQMRYKTKGFDHICIRNSTFTGTGGNSGNSSVIYWYGTADHIADTIIIYNNTISNFGDILATTENDYHGLMPSSYSRNSWILNNTMYKNGGDSIQVGSVTFTEATRPKYVYIGNNVMHEDRENAVDIKSADHVVVSGNTAYGYKPSSSSEGAAIVAHNSPDNVWVINNIVHDSPIGITSTGSTETYFIGNIVYNCATAIHIRGATTGGVINNTLYGYTSGFTTDTGGLKILNNIFANKQGTAGYDLSFGSTTYVAPSTVDNLLFANPEATIKVGASSISLAAFKSTYNKCTSFCQQNTNNFVAPAKYDFTLLDTSVAIDNGAKSDVYSLYLQQFDVTLSTDFNGTLRPSGPAYDIGADEYGIDVLPVLPSPTFLNIFIK